MVTGVDDGALQVDASLLPDASWVDLRALLGKPGHFISALRRFPYMVDSGRLPASNVSIAKQCLEAASSDGDLTPDEERLVPPLRIWLEASFEYSKVIVAGSPDSPSGFSSTPTGSPNRKGVAGTTPTGRSSTAGRTPSNQPGSAGGAQPTPTRGEAILASRRNSNGSAAVNRTNRPIPVPVRGGTPPGVTSNSLDKGASRFSTASSQAGYPRHIARDVVAVQDLKAQIEQLKKETRQMKSMQANIKWKLHRQDDMQRLAEKKKDKAEILAWRDQQRAAGAELEEMIREERKKAELSDGKDYQEFKRDVKELAHQLELERKEDAYLQQKENSEWVIERKREMCAEQQRLTVQEHLEQTNFLAEYRLEEQTKEDYATREDRLELERAEMDLALQSAQLERELAAEALEQTKEDYATREDRLELERAEMDLALQSAQLERELAAEALEHMRQSSTLPISVQRHMPNVVLSIK
eukprot:TRINITY_DN31900_c0_g1_i1.p1 TRINITY_DN31900_c0_g1~~TRINITY_DN31900_c0_g1_i1.p1  ORF type:complete len:470 (+),score=134.29 TRINITY_DN31900_c0_g1_i1:2-1411(+)